MTPQYKIRLFFLRSGYREKENHKNVSGKYHPIQFYLVGNGKYQKENKRQTARENQMREFPVFPGKDKSPNGNNGNNGNKWTDCQQKARQKPRANKRLHRSAIALALAPQIRAPSSTNASLDSKKNHRYKQGSTIKQEKK